MKRELAFAEPDRALGLVLYNTPEAHAGRPHLPRVTGSVKTTKESIAGRSFPF